MTPPDALLERQSIIRRLQDEAVMELRGIGTDAPFCLLDFPDHANVGDSAIWLGSMAFFREQRSAEPRYVASIDDHRWLFGK